MTSQLILGSHGAFELRERGSRFVALAVPVRSEAELLRHVDRARVEHRGAHHFCYAFRLLDGTARSMDDGEPARSAGLPILQVIEGRALFDVAVVVVRHFGGTKLGVGGLVRAYGGAAAGALDAATVRHARQAVQLTVRYPYAMIGAVVRLLDAAAVRQRHGFANAGASGETLAVVCREEVEPLVARLRDATGGEAEVRIGAPTMVVLPAPA